MSTRDIPSPGAAACIVAVPYDDPRAADLRRVLDADLGARYDGFHGEEPPERRLARSRALAVHPDEIVATLLALVGDAPAGHVIVRRLDADWELKRLIVAAPFRGRGIARALVSAAIDAARTDAARTSAAHADAARTSPARTSPARTDPARTADVSTAMPDAAGARVILQTGLQQPESIALYASMGFTRIPVYEPYVETMPRSVCFALAL
ncbi:MAG: GNAT family N-acetyltransferase [Microbacterium arborescens]